MSLGDLMRGMAYAHGSEIGGDQFIEDIENNLNPNNITPLRNLTENTPEHHFTIKVRVIYSSGLQHKNDKDILSLVFVDKNSTYMEGTFFAQSALRYGNNIEVGSVYLIGGATVKRILNKNRKYVFGGLNNNLYYLQYGLVGGMRKVENDNEIPIFFNTDQTLDFQTLDSLEKNSFVETVIGKIVRDDQIVTFQSKGGNNITKRDIYLKKLGVEIKLTLFGEKAKERINVGDILYITKTKVNEYFSNYSLCSSYSSVLIVNPTGVVVEGTENASEGIDNSNKRKRNEKISPNKKQKY